MPKKIDYTNKKVGKLKLIKRVEEKRDTNGSYFWEYICDCGNKGIISSQLIRVVKHRSCGCNSKFNTNPRVKNHTLLKAFHGMHDRCYNKENPNYYNYGGRGITVCERWHSYNNYYDDVINTWAKGLWADRIDNNKGYEPLNFRWVTPKESGRNTRNVKLTKEKAEIIKKSNLSNSELSKMFGVHYETIREIRTRKRIWVD